MPPQSRRRRRHSAASSWREGEGWSYIIYTGICDKCHILHAFFVYSKTLLSVGFLVCWLLFCAIFSSSTKHSFIRHSYDLISVFITQFRHDAPKIEITHPSFNYRPVLVLTIGHWTEASLQSLQAHCHKHLYLWPAPG